MLQRFLLMTTKILWEYHSGSTFHWASFDHVSEVMIALCMIDWAELAESIIDCLKWTLIETPCSAQIYSDRLILAVRSNRSSKLVVICGLFMRKNTLFAILEWRLIWRASDNHASMKVQVSKVSCPEYRNFLISLFKMLLSQYGQVMSNMRIIEKWKWMIEN